MPTRGTSGHRPASAATSPERQPSEHSRLAMPRGRGSTSTQDGSQNASTGTGWEGWRDEPVLELDGEWLGDAIPPPEPSAEKEREQESPAMSLLLSITRAAATAVPGLSPRAGGIVERSRFRRPRAGSVGTSSRGAGSGSIGGSRGNSIASPQGEFYRLPWYRRPLPPPIPGGIPMGGQTPRRSSTPCTSRRVGMGPRSGFESRSSESFGASPASGEEFEDTERRRRSRSPLNTSVDEGLDARANLTVDAASTPDPPLTIAPRRPVEDPSSLRVAAAAAATAAMEAGEAAAKDRVMPAVTAFPSAVAEAVVLATPAANSMEADRNSICGSAGPGVDSWVEGNCRRSEVEENRRLNNEVHRLKNEVDRLKREMAAMAAAAATATVTPAGVTTNTNANANVNTSTDDELKTPVTSTKVSPLQLSASSEKKASPSPDSSSRPMLGRPVGRALRPDDSWLRGRRSSSDSSGNGFDRGSRFEGVLPTLASDGTGDADGSEPLSYSTEFTPMRSGAHTACEGPSPASGEKFTEGLAASVAAASADVDRTCAGSGESSSSGGVVVCGGGGGRNGSARSTRPLPVFFPVQDPPEVSTEESAGGGAAAAAGMKDKYSSLKDTRTNGAPPQDANTDKSPADKSASVVGGGGAEGGGKECARANRRRRDGKSDGQEWRWVLVQRTGNESVRQALMSHGLPPPKRRSIWATWAALAHPESGARTKAKIASSLGDQIKNVIASDVQRTKISHPIFSSGAQGMNMLKRVLLRCAELGAVKEAGYIQGMNYMAGFLMATITEAVVSERDSSDDRNYGGYRVANGVNPEPSDASAGGADGGTLASELQEAAVREAVGRKWDGKALEPTAEEMEVIETECVQVMLGLIALQGGILSRDLWGLHANTELLEELLTRHCPYIMDHLRSVKLGLIVLTPRWFICIYAASLVSHSLVARIWDLFLWYGRRGPAVLVWVALALLNGSRHHLLEIDGLSAAAKAVRRYSEGCKTFDDLVRQAPIGLSQVVAAWEEKGNNRRIANMDGEDLVPDRMVGGLVQEMSGDIMISVSAPRVEGSSPPTRHRRSVSNVGPVASTSASTGFGIQFPSTPGRPPTPLTSPRSPFPEWAANIFRSSTGGGGPMDVEGVAAAAAAASAADRDRERPPVSPRMDGASREGKGRSYGRSASGLWW